MFDTNAVASGTPSKIVKPWTEKFTVFAEGAISGGAPGNGVLLVQVSNKNVPDANDWKLAGTITLTLGTTKTNDVLAIAVPYRNVRVLAQQVDGTNAWVNAHLGSA